MVLCPTQLPGRLFSPSDISKKLSHHFLLHFWINIGSYNHHEKYQGVFQDLLENTFFHNPLDKENLNEFKGGTLMKKCFIEGPETHPDIVKWNKKWWDSFLLISLGLNSLPRSCAYLIVLTQIWSVVYFKSTLSQLQFYTYIIQQNFQ